MWCHIIEVPTGIEPYFGALGILAVQAVVVVVHVPILVNISTTTRAGVCAKDLDKKPLLCLSSTSWGSFWERDGSVTISSDFKP